MTVLTPALVRAVIFFRPNLNKAVLCEKKASKDDGVDWSGHDCTSRVLSSDGLIARYRYWVIR